MNFPSTIRIAGTSLCALLLASALASGNPAGADKPVKVYILAGQSNMVGIGQVMSGSIRWGKEFSDTVVSIYEGAYDPAVDYDTLDPIKSQPLGTFTGEGSTAFPEGGTAVVRGHFAVSEDGNYQFNPGWNESTYNIMTVNGTEVYRKGHDGAITQREIRLTAGEKVPFTITYLKPVTQAVGWYRRTDTPGTLTTLVKHQGQFPYLLDQDGEWVSRDDVWYKGVITATANQWLAPGCGATPTAIGPELGFGHKIGDHHKEPVLIIKASQGNRSLAWDFLPPGSKRFETGDTIHAGYKDPKPSWPKGETPEANGWYAGKQYDDCFNAAKEVLANFDENFPHWAGRRYEIAGFAWFQGHKDSGSEVHSQRYETNLVRLIHSLRKDFNAPNAPFVVAVGCGSEGREGNGLTIANAQLAVSGESGKYPEFEGNVITVETRDYFPAVEESPRNQGFHYHQNAGAYMKIGEAMGRGMLEIIGK